MTIKKYLRQFATICQYSVKSKILKIASIDEMLMNDNLTDHQRKRLNQLYNLWTNAEELEWQVSAF